MDLGLYEGESHFGCGCLEEMDSSFPFELKPRAPGFLGYIRSDPQNAKGSGTSQAKPTKPVTCSLVSMGPCSVTMVVSYWILGSMSVGAQTIFPWLPWSLYRGLRSLGKVPKIPMSLI